MRRCNIVATGPMTAEQRLFQAGGGSAFVAVPEATARGDSWGADLMLNPRTS